MTQKRGRSRGPVAVAAGLVAGLIVSGFSVWSASAAAFSGVAANTGNAWNGASVQLGANGGTGAMFLANTPVYLPGAGHEEQRCIRVTYTGTVLPATAVKVYSSTAGDDPGDLSEYLHLKIEVGTDAVGPANYGCGTFVSTGTPWAYNTVTKTRRLDDFRVTHNTYGSGLSSAWIPASSGDSRVFRISTYVDDDNSANGKSISAIPFHWEVQVS